MGMGMFYCARRSGIDVLEQQLTQAEILQRQLVERDESGGGQPMHEPTGVFGADQGAVRELLFDACAEVLVGMRPVVAIIVIRNALAVCVSRVEIRYWWRPERPVIPIHK